MCPNRIDHVIKRSDHRRSNEEQQTYHTDEKLIISIVLQKCSGTQNKTAPSAKGKRNPKRDKKKTESNVFLFRSRRVRRRTIRWRRSYCCLRLSVKLRCPKAVSRGNVAAHTNLHRLRQEQPFFNQKMFVSVPAQKAAADRPLSLYIRANTTAAVQVGRAPCRRQTTCYLVFDTTTICTCDTRNPSGMLSSQRDWLHLALLVLL